jgi:radical SAM protein with 4Fe4S-binding SPASM domain
MQQIKPDSVEKGLCAGAFNQITIDALGRVACCPKISKPFARIDQRTSLKDILRDKKYMKKRMEIIKDSCEGCWLACTRDEEVQKDTHEKKPLVADK